MMHGAGQGPGPDPAGQGDPLQRGNRASGSTARWTGTNSTKSSPAAAPATPSGWNAAARHTRTAPGCAKPPRPTRPRRHRKHRWPKWQQETRRQWRSPSSRHPRRLRHCRTSSLAAVGSLRPLHPRPVPRPRRFPARAGRRHGPAQRPRPVHPPQRGRVHLGGPGDAIAASDPDAKGAFFESPQGKDYRHATYYTKSEGVKHL